MGGAGLSAITLAGTEKVLEIIITNRISNSKLFVLIIKENISCRHAYSHMTRT